VFYVHERALVELAISRRRLLTEAAGGRQQHPRGDSTRHQLTSGRRGAKRSERSEDGTPAARDPPEGDCGAYVSRSVEFPRAGHAQISLLHSPRGHKGA
jgi:hypothetical protein